ncbi:hypothetical protein F2Q70_00022432, partial [Brassica cretica]
MGADYPAKPMALYATIWDASDWATSGGKYKANYKFAPFVAEFKSFSLDGCSVDPIQEVPVDCADSVEKMQNPHCTINCFDYGGYYIKDGDEMKWISGDGEEEDEIHTIVLKKSVDEITRSVLVERICRKIKLDDYKMEVKISYFPM